MNEEDVFPKTNVPSCVGEWWRWNKGGYWEVMPVYLDSSKGTLYRNWSYDYPVKDDGLWGGPVVKPSWTPKEKP